ncbi:MAG: peptide-methionine (S)-S-oxide reductase MsrA [Rhodothermaceae bacterium]|nr:peptide-methionine (S)-S-oxide reductase MsrA [Rhodothermaceae bacterium]
MKMLETATLGGGCFWCVEAVMLPLRGVERVVSGFSGGHVKNPSYREVCTGRTGHAEVVQVTFDAEQISYADVLHVFFATHDPTSLNRQGADVGEHYRSVILTHDDAQRETAEAVIAELEADRVFDRPIVTQVVPFEAFYPAEAYHQDYFANNPAQPYCQAVIAPKVAKLRKHYLDKLTPA